ncbi:MAG: hypothetical protein ACRCTW_07115, partial [Lactococcus garvieae]
MIVSMRGDAARLATKEVGIERDEFRNLLFSPLPFFNLQKNIEPFQILKEKLTICPKYLAVVFILLPSATPSHFWDVMAQQLRCYASDQKVNSSDFSSMIAGLLSEDLNPSFIRIKEIIFYCFLI